jgi:hypothetical protein
VKLLYSFVCEFARSRQDGRVDAEGVFHELRAPGFPARQGELMFVAVIEWGPKERGSIPFSIDIVDPAGRPYLRDGEGAAVRIADGTTEVRDFGPQHGPPLTPFILPIQNLPFLRPGVHQFVVTVNGVKVKAAQLHLIEVPEDAAGARA